MAMPLKYLGFWFLNLVYLVATLVPKDRRLWLFSSWNGRKFLDNPKYLFKYLIHAEKPAEGGIRAVWIAKDRTLCREMSAQGLPVAYAFSVRGILLQLRAGAVVFTHSPEWDFVPCFIGYTTKRVQTWHGMPIKKIGYDDQKMGPSLVKMRIRKALFPFTTDRYDLVIAGSEDEKKLLASAFRASPGAVRVTGYPRNDALLAVRGSEPEDKGPKKFIYMPTFRGGVGSEFKLLAGSGLDYEKADRSLEAANAELHIKLHPVQVFARDDLDRISRSRRIRAIFNTGDFYEVLGGYHAVITDFSGVFFDFLITGRPVVMAPIAMEAYLREDRDLYYRYEDICPDAPCTTWEEVFSRILEVSQPGYTVPEAYQKLQRRFHAHLDAGSSKRVASEVKRLVGVACGESL